jgi:hypothetical protein
MKTAHPPRLATWILERFGPGDEGLTGDLIEELGRGRSRVWFWRQVIGAVVTGPRRQPRVVRPLRLTDEPDPLAAAPGRREINLTASPIYGIGGLGLVAFAVLISVMSPGSWLVALAILLSGAALGAILGVVRQRRALHPPAPPSVFNRR